MSKHTFFIPPCTSKRKGLINARSEYPQGQPTAFRAITTWPIPKSHLRARQFSKGRVNRLPLGREAPGATPEGFKNLRNLRRPGGAKNLLPLDSKAPIRLLTRSMVPPSGTCPIKKLHARCTSTTPEPEPQFIGWAYERMTWHENGVACNRDISPFFRLSP